MLEINPKDRITAKDALSDPWFNDIPDKLKNME